MADNFIYVYMNFMIKDTCLYYIIMFGGEMTYSAYPRQWLKVWTSIPRFHALDRVYKSALYTILGNIA